MIAITQLISKNGVLSRIWPDVYVRFLVTLLCTNGQGDHLLLGIIYIA